MEYVTREGYLQEELLPYMNAPAFLNHNICRYELSTFLPSLLLLLSIRASCVETFEVHLRAFLLRIVMAFFM